MITEIKINNFKSVADLTLPLGRFNVLIGANGSGKSNILEAIAFGGAASADKLDNEFLGGRGIRAASVQLMKSAFLNANLSNPIELTFKSETNEITFRIEDKNKIILEWDTETSFRFLEPKGTWKYSISEKISKEAVDYLLKELSSFLETDLFQSLSKENKNLIIDFIAQLKGFDENDNDENQKKIFSSLYTNFFLNIYNKVVHNKEIDNFIIYSPEISSLRKFEEESQIKPLGVKGEGMFSVLQIFYENYGEETIVEIRKYLHVIEWFDDFEAIFDKVSGRKGLVVKDRNLPDVTLNQTNVNEGFLFLLFYISLIISKETPAFFAIDNIEASLHPLLCEELIKILVELSKKHNKQIILTTHNPFVLDGLDLNDPEQKLFVVERNGDGETIAFNIDRPVKNVKLSEAWMRGYIGGNPETIY
jgi:predicted ATPase